MIEATNNGVKRELIPAGSHLAICYSMVHIGTITEEIQGVEKRMNKVRITWEIPSETREFDGEMKPLVISKEYTLSMHEKATLRRDLESWRGKGFTEDEAKRFDITKLLGKPCILSIIHSVAKSGNMYAGIGSISGIIKGMAIPELYNPIFEFNYTDQFSDEKVEKFPEFIRDKIKQSEEYIALKLGETDMSDETPNPQHINESDDLPF